MSRFAKEASFRRARFGRHAMFWGTQFIGEAAFQHVRFGGNAEFQSSQFRREAWFSGSRFNGDAFFDDARIDGNGWFDDVRFGANTRFRKTSFLGEVAFDRARFSGHARFGGARVSGDAWFGEVSFEADAAFHYAHFRGKSQFGNSHFYGYTVFYKTRFDGCAVFDRTHFSDSLRFHKAHFRSDVNFNDATFAADAAFPRAIICQIVAFTGATLHRRLRLDEAQLRRHARFRFDRLLLIGDAVIELEYAHIQRLDELRERFRQRYSLWRRLRFDFVRLLGAPHPPVLIDGEDTLDTDKLRRGAANYDLLASSFARQPAKSREEDLCRWRAHTLRHRADSLATFQRDERGVWPNADLVFFVRDVLYRFLVQRLAAGYLLYPMHLVFTAILVILAGALIYGFNASPDTITYNGPLPDTLPSGAAELKADLIDRHSHVADADVYGLWHWHRPDWPWRWGSFVSGLYFSMTTFVTIGYGEFAPQGWFKLVAGLQGLAGVTLLALFVVAWGRKLVR